MSPYPGTSFRITPAGTLRLDWPDGVCRYSRRWSPTLRLLADRCREPALISEQSCSWHQTLRRGTIRAVLTSSQNTRLRPCPLLCTTSSPVFQLYILFLSTLAAVQSPSQSVAISSSEKASMVCSDEAHDAEYDSAWGGRRSLRTRNGMERMRKATRRCAYIDSRRKWVYRVS